MTDRATWDDGTTEIFIHACLEQVYARERRSTSFTVKGWKAIVASFNEKTGKGFERKQLKNRFDVLKKELRTWDMLLNETGLGRDPETGALDASDEWWRQKCRENSAYKKFRYAPLKYERELRIIFRDLYANGDDSYCPAFRQTETDEANEEDVYRPTMDSTEGSGDSTDESFGAQPAPSTGVTDDLASLGLSQQSGPSNPSRSGSQGKRKRGHRQVSRKKAKEPATQRIADAVSIMANVSMDRTAMMDEIQQRSADNVIKDLITLEEVQANPEFRIQCIQMLTEDPSSRNTFATLFGNKQYVLEWLHFAVERHFR